METLTITGEVDDCTRYMAKIDNENYYILVSRTENGLEIDIKIPYENRVENARIRAVVDGLSKELSRIFGGG